MSEPARDTASFYALLEELARESAACGPCHGRGEVSVGFEDPPLGWRSKQSACIICGGRGYRPFFVHPATFLEAIETRGLLPADLLQDPVWSWYCHYCGSRGHVPYDNIRWPCLMCHGSPNRTPESIDELLAWVTFGGPALVTLRALLRELAPLERVVLCPPREDLPALFPDESHGSATEQALRALGFDRGRWERDRNVLLLVVPPIRAFPWR